MFSEFKHMVLKEIADETYNNNMVTTKLIHSKFDIVFACNTVSMEKEISVYDSVSMSSNCGYPVNCSSGSVVQ